MRKQLLTLTILAAFVAPATAQSGYDGPADLRASGANSGVVERGTSSGASNDAMDNPGVDTTTTGSIVNTGRNDATGNGYCDNGAGGNPSSDPQCRFYGANSH